MLDNLGCSRTPSPFYETTPRVFLGVLLGKAHIQPELLQVETPLDGPVWHLPATVLHRDRELQTELLQRALGIHQRTTPIAQLRSPSALDRSVRFASYLTSVITSENSS